MNKIDDLPDIRCKNCGTYYFQQIYMVKRISGIISKSGKTEILPYPLLICANPECNTILEDADDDKKEETKSNLIL